MDRGQNLERSFNLRSVPQLCFCVAKLTTGDRLPALMKHWGLITKVKTCFVFCLTAKKYVTKKAKDVIDDAVELNDVFIVFVVIATKLFPTRK
jgi:hypothetical protein